ncbi:Vgb family protein [Siccirubricoccus phaeus]|uniref:Vgb family protein n=1 Tax=Siccirubricoccus phaeus TaxID=2595053 RepID=UPI0011F3C6D6|nr:PQQ-binding-like beta-propeller repeat protein [Siccirubricoccus phaeus]
MQRQPAEILREYGPFPGSPPVHGVSFDGSLVWFATGPQLQALEPESGALARAIEVPAEAGTAFDGRHLYQIGEGKIRKIDPATGQVLASLALPDEGGYSGMAWAEGSLWVGQCRNRRIHRIDPETGTVLRTIETQRVVTGVTWVEGELWHGSWEGEESALLRIDPGTGEALEHLDLPPGTDISGLEADGGGRFFCGGGTGGKLRAVRRPQRA